MSDIYRAKQPFMCTGIDGAPRQIAVGDLVSASDPVLKGRQTLFEKVEVHVDRTEQRRAGHSETATAAPGEKRSIGLTTGTATSAQKPGPDPSKPGENVDKTGEKSVDPGKQTPSSSPTTTGQSSAPATGSATGKTTGSKR